LRERKPQPQGSSQEASVGGLHVVLGAGQVGPLVARSLLARGHGVRVVRKTAHPVAVAGMTLNKK
jgi:hypothetical protein